MADDTPSLNLLELAADLTVAWLANPNTRASASEVGEALRTIHTEIVALGESGGDASESAAAPIAAVSVRRSLASPDHIVSMIDGKSYKTLRRHLSTHGLSPEDYRRRFGLRSDYPMVAPAYAAMRSAMAKSIGLGRKRGETRTSAKLSAPPSTPAKRRGRPPKSA